MMSEFGVPVLILFIAFVLVPLTIIAFNAMSSITKIREIDQKLMDLEREIVVPTIEGCKANNFTGVVQVSDGYLANCTRIKEELEEFCKKHGSVRLFTFTVDCRENLK